MKILILLPNDSMGGAEQYLKMIASYYQNQKVDIFFLSKKQTNSWDDISPNIALNYPKKNAKFITVMQFMLKNVFASNKTYDYIFTSHVYATGLVGIMTMLNFLKTNNFVARESTSIFVRFKGLKLLSYKLFYWIGYRKVDLLICQTNFMKEQLVKGFPKLEKLTKIVVLPNPIDFRLIKKKTSNAIKTILPDSYIVSAGRLIPEKGFDILIRVFAKLRHTCENLNLIILGEGDERANLENLIDQLTINNAVDLPGFVDNVYPFFRNSKVCVVSSRVEGFPNVLLQMMSQNEKVVSTTCAGGIEEIPGIFTSDTENEEKLECAIMDALNSNENNRPIFDDYLSKRDISSFIAKIQFNLKKKSQK